MRVVDCRNRHAAADRFEIAATDWLAADRLARAQGLEVVGVWHSHPGGPAIPSAADRDGAWPEYCSLIGSVSAAGTGEWRAWRLVGGAFREQNLVVPRELP